MTNRLLRLEQIVAATPGGASTPRDATDVADVHLGSVAWERLRLLTALLEERKAQPVDAADTLTMRLLLNEYAGAVRHLRAVAQTTDARLTAAAQPIREGMRFLRRVRRSQGETPD